MRGMRKWSLGAPPAVASKDQRRCRLPTRYESGPVTPHLKGLFSELVLASTSPSRRALLTTLGMPFRAETPGVEETVPPGTPTRASVAMLAERKARAVLARWPQALVI